MRILRAIAVTAAVTVSLAALAACSMQMQPEATTVRKIAVLQPPEPEKYSADVSHPSGVLGRMADQMRGVSTESDRFTAGLKGKGFALAGRLAERTAQALRAQGYEVVLVRDAYKVRNGVTQIEYDKSAVEAVLTFDFDTAGYLAPRADAPYQPALAVAVSLARTAALEFVPLYKQRFMFGWEGHTGTWTHLPAPSQFTYRGYDELMAGQAEAGRALYVGADVIAARIAQDLSPKR